MAWPKTKARQLELWERKMFRSAPIQKLLQEAIGLLHLINGNAPVVRLLHEILRECLERAIAATARDSEFWNEMHRRDDGQV